MTEGAQPEAFHFAESRPVRHAHAISPGNRRSAENSSSIFPAVITQAMRRPAKATHGKLKVFSRSSPGVAHFRQMRIQIVDFVAQMVKSAAEREES